MGNHLLGLSTTNLFPTADRTASENSVDFDKSVASGFMGFLLDCAAAGAGTNPTAAFKIQSGTEALGQSYTTEGTNDIGLRVGAADNVKLAAKFTQSGAKSVKFVDLLLKRVGTIAGTDTITASIFADSSGPTGSTLGDSVAVVASSIGTEYEWVRFTFTSPVTVAASTDYWIVLTGAYDAGATNIIKWQAATVASGGNSSIYDASWAADETKSFLFKEQQVTFADVTGGDFTAVTATASRQLKVVNMESLGRRVRAVFTIGGTNTPSFIASLNALYMPTPRT